MKALGLIINPIAGIGGKVGLKGSDGPEIQQRARELGAIPESMNRAISALQRLEALRGELQVITPPSEMGEEAAQVCHFRPTVVGAIQSGATMAQDTRNAARDLRRLNVDLILFAGGDGTARDIYAAIGDSVPVLGIPAGVKIHSSVFAINPVSAGDLAALYLQGKVTILREAEVMDLDEEAYRQGVVCPRLYGYMRIPFQLELVQATKSPSRPDERGILDAIAAQVIDQMQVDWLYFVGPGTTTRPILTHLGLNKTLIGVDVIRNQELVAADANEATLLELLKRYRAKIIVTPIGGQGYLFGRGNQQFSPAVIRQVRGDNIIVVSSADKIHSLGGRSLLVDTGDPEVNTMLSGYVKVITGYNEWIVYRVMYLPTTDIALSSV